MGMAEMPARSSQGACICFLCCSPQEAASPPFGTAGKLKVVIFVSADCGEGRAAGWEQLLHGTSKRWKCKTWLFFFSKHLCLGDVAW